MASNKPNLHDGVREDWTIEGYDVETYLHAVHGFYVDRVNQFLAINFDNGGVDGEVRIPLDCLMKEVDSLDEGGEL